MGINKIEGYIQFNYIWALNRGTCVRDSKVQHSLAWTESTERQKLPQERSLLCKIQCTSHSAANSSPHCNSVLCTSSTSHTAGTLSSVPGRKEISLWLGWSNSRCHKKFGKLLHSHDTLAQRKTFLARPEREEVNSLACQGI